MLIQKFVLGPIDNNTYVVVSEESKKAFVIDPSFGSIDKLSEFLEKNSFTLEAILLTHSHWDHIADVKIIKDKFFIPIYVHKLDAKSLENPGPIEFLPSLKVEGVKPDVLLEADKEIKVADINILVLHTPGHTPGGVCYLIEKEKTLFSGDTLFKGSFGRVDFPYSNPEDMIKSLKKLSMLDSDTKVYPGHGSQTTIGKENWMKNADKFI